MADWTSDTIPKNIMETLVVDDLAVNYEISAGTIQAKNACTAWVHFDGTTTPPTIRDSFNVRDVVRTATGYFDIYFETQMDNDNCSVSGTTYSAKYLSTISVTLDKATVLCRSDSGINSNVSHTSVQIFGGKN
jgi:hypothetical protein